MSIGGLRQGAKSIVDGGKAKAGKGRYKQFLQLRLPTLTDEVQKKLRPVDKIEEPIVIVPGQYDNFNYVTRTPYVGMGKHFLEHNFVRFEDDKRTGQKYKRFKKFPCSAGRDPHNLQPCVGCFLADRGENGANARDQWVFNIAHFIRYHQIPYEKNGNIVTNKESGQPIMIMIECSSWRTESWVHATQQHPNVCRGCQQRVPFYYGGHRYLQVGSSHLGTIEKWEKEASSHCRNCGTGAQPLKYCCPSCKTDLLHMSAIRASWTFEQIELYEKTPTQCARCYAQVMPFPILDCGYDDRGIKSYQSCAERGGATTPFSLDDFVYEARREGTGTDTEIVAVTRSPIGQFKLYQGTPEETVLTEQLIDSVVPEILDFDKMFGPWPVKEQADFLNMQDPFVSSGQVSVPPGMPPGGMQPPQMAPPMGYAPPMGPPPQPTAQPAPYAPPGPQQQGPGVVYPNVPNNGRPQY